MPHIAITMIPGRDEETKQALALKIQAFLVGELDIDPSLSRCLSRTSPRKSGLSR